MLSEGGDASASAGAGQQRKPLPGVEFWCTDVDEVVS
jgi:hypothetical protein